MNPAIDVLVVDDEPVVGDAVRLVLEDAGLRVARARDGESALAHPAFAECRMVLCDVLLPGMSGLDVLRAMRERRPNLPIVIITGYATAGTADRTLEAGASAFLAKPFDDRELLELVRRVLGFANVPREGESS